jgi:gluconolactonase
MRRMPHALARPILCICLACAAAALQGAARQQPTAPQTGHEYVLGPDSQLQPGVPAGKVMQHSWTSKIYPGTVRDYWVYVPAQYDAATPACVMVFQDGAGYVKADGGWRVPVVFDNLIHKKEMPVTIGIFVNPGVAPAPSEAALPRFNRSVEYDSVTDRYARFLLDEIIPEVGRTYNLRTDGNSRAIAGASSGAIAAFAAAWNRPDAFTRIFSTIGTYVGLRGGNDFPTLIRKTERKPVRVFLQDGSNDLDNHGGNWFLANQEMLSAFDFAGYDVEHTWGDGAHDSKHGGSILPDALRWLWRGYPAPIAPVGESKQPVATTILPPNEGWRLVGEGYGFTDGPAANAKGEVFFADVPKNRVYRVALDGSLSVFAENSGGASGLMFGADGRLYACQTVSKRVVAWDMDGHESVLADGIEPNDLAVTYRGHVYVTDPGHKQVWLVTGGGEKQVVDTGIVNPNGVILSPDQTLLYIADTAGQFVYSFRIAADGSLTDKEPFYHLHLEEGTAASHADGMTVDTLGNLYVTTELGVQVADQAGKVTGIIGKPQRTWLANVAFGGAAFDQLYVTSRDKVYKRRMRTTGALPFLPPIKPPTPRL